MAPFFVVILRTSFSVIARSAKALRGDLSFPHPSRERVGVRVISPKNLFAKKYPPPFVPPARGGRRKKKSFLRGERKTKTTEGCFLPRYKGAVQERIRRNYVFIVFRKTFTFPIKDFGNDRKRKLTILFNFCFIIMESKSALCALWCGLET